jgi:transcriptional regulator with XRE-family HTH domain
MRIRQIREVEVERLGERIKAARLAISNVKSLEQILEEVNFSRTYWYDLEKETLKGTLSIENLRKIEKSLGVDFGVSFDEEGECALTAGGAR